MPTQRPTALRRGNRTKSNEKGTQVMGKQITVSFEQDVPEEQLEELREKIRKILRGEAVAEAEVVGQWSGGDPGNVGSVPGLR